MDGTTKPALGILVEDLGEVNEQVHGFLLYVTPEQWRVYFYRVERVLVLKHSLHISRVIGESECFFFLFSRGRAGRHTAYMGPIQEIECAASEELAEF